jgi:hypothetical protein
MKKTILLFALTLSVVFVSCKNSEEKTTTPENDPNLTEQAQNQPLFRGEFIYLKKENAAVLKGSDYIYGVVIDDMSMALANQVNNVKKDSLDMVPVIVRGLVEKNPNLTGEGEGWSEIITIKEIINVSDKPAEADIKIEETKE